MFTGILYALAACFVWGFIFIIPHLTHDFDAFETALGRHGVYGTLSCFFLFYYTFKCKRTFPVRVWSRAICCALLANIIYYSCVVVGVRYASPSITALLLGLGPITISLYGNWQEKECSFRKLIFPSILIILGLILVNIPVFQSDAWEFYYLIGTLAVLFSLGIWSWYVVANTRFLKNNPEITAQQWSTLMGSATFVWVIFLGTCYEYWQGMENWGKFAGDAPEIGKFILGCLMLGIVCSFFGSYFWNNASMRLPVSFAGQLTIFETVFGLIFFYLLEQQLPPIVELFGIGLMLLAIVYGINTFVAKTCP